MEIKLINYTTDALELLLYTKNTRLQGQMSLKDIKDMPKDWKYEQLSYMRDTIKSSWEFVDYTFEINGVSRAFTHQLVRSRQGSYAQESHRSGDLSDHKWVSPDGDKYGHDTLHEDNNIMAISFGG
jgi:thymidylate synthase ThyX